MSPASLGIVCFRRRGEKGESEAAAEQRNSGLVRAFEATGQGLVSSTRLHGRYAIRLCVMNHTSTAADVERVLDWFADAEAPDLPTSAGELGASSPRQAAAEHGWLARREVATHEVGSIDLFRDLSDDLLGCISEWASELSVAVGDEVTRAWDSARDFYVILEGSAAVERDGREQGRLRAGDFFGEIAALDWGAGYGYARSATVTAIEPLRLLVLDPAHLSRLMAEAPSVAETVQTAVRARSLA
jgi:mannose-6-phosphate isomerase-like protein (cupin superfamily)